MKIFENIVGQPQVVRILEKAIQASRKSEDDNQEMTHSWLFAGPPGSGKSVAAMAFAASLVCPNNGCGQCVDCETAMNNSHLDIDIVDSKSSPIKIDEIRELISRSSTSPYVSNWKITIINSVEQLTETAANALLKAIEEPGIRTVWILCVSSSTEVLPTIKSRCRLIEFGTLSNYSIVEFVKQNFELDLTVAKQVALYSEGNLNKAKIYAENLNLITWRKIALKSLLEVQDVETAYTATSKILENLELIVSLSTNDSIDYDLVKKHELSKKIKDKLEKDQKNIKIKLSKDLLEQCFIDYLTICIDVIKIKLMPNLKIINAEWEEEIRNMNYSKTEKEVLNTINSIFFVKKLLDKNISTQLILEVFFCSILKN